jgi:uncharacterized protein
LNLPIHNKGQEVRRILAKYGRVAVAFSGGVDSSLLLWLALDTLGPANVLALTARSRLLPPRDLERAAGWPARHGLADTIIHVFVDIRPLSWDEFTSNPADRCYLCKSRVYRIFLEHAKRQGVTMLLDGTNADDLHSERPGLRALHELAIVTPLAAAGLHKLEVRALSRELGLDTWDAPSASCLATRIPEGLVITAERLARIDILEAHLERHGYAGCRVRLDLRHKDTVYVQVQEKDLPRLAAEQERTALFDFFNDSGVKKVFLDLRGR